MKKIIAGAFGLVMAGTIFVGCEPTKYEHANFSDSASIKKQANTYWEKQGWWTLPKDVKKVAITEFSVAYVTENVSTSGAGALSIMGAAEMFGAGRRVRQYTQHFKESFPTELYQGFVKSMEEEGIEVVPMEKVAGNPNFAKLAGSKPGKTNWAADRNLIGGTDGRNKTKSEVWPLKGLPVVDDGWFNAGGNAQAEAALAGENGAQAYMRVRMRVALTDDGYAVVDAGSTVRINWGVQSGKGLSGPMWYSAGAGFVNSKAALRDDVPVVSKKEFAAFKGDVYAVETDKFKASILKMYPAFTQMAISKLKE